jgi:hypothetical protein
MRILHRKYKFLERINGRRYHRTGEREKSTKKEIIDYLLSEKLTSYEEIKEMQEEMDKLLAQANIDFKDEEAIDKESDSHLLEEEVDRDALLKAEKFKKNFEDLEEFGKTYQSQFSALRDKFNESMESTNQSLLDTKMNISSNFKGRNIEPPFELDFQEELQSANFMKKSKTEMTGLGEISESKGEEDEEERKEVGLNHSQSIISEKTKPETPLKARGRDFRLKTFSREKMSGRRPELGVGSIQWHQKDLKKQNEEILRMLERTRKEPPHLPRIPGKPISHGLPPSKLA